MFIHIEDDICTNIATLSERKYHEKIAKEKLTHEKLVLCEIHGLLVEKDGSQ